MLYAKNDSLNDYNNINDFNLVKEYLDYNSSYKSETSIITYKSCLKVFYEFLISYLTNIDKDYLAKQIDRKTIEHFINYQAGKKLGEDIIHCRIMVVKDYLKYLAKNKVITMQKFFNIFDDLKMPKPKIKNQICIKSNEAMRLIEILKKQKDTFVNRRNILTILLMSNTGIRRKEIALINPNAIDFENNTIMIYKTKGSKPRIIGFSECIKSIKHPATFPLWLAKDHIKSWSNEGDIVLDPFMGSGTTAVACKELNRKFIGCDIEASYLEFAKERMK